MLPTECSRLFPCQKALITLSFSHRQSQPLNETRRDSPYGFPLIKYTGLRPGEKLFEELITQGESVVPTAHKLIVALRHNGHDADAASARERVDKQLDELLAACDSFNTDRIKAIVKEIVPEYV